MPAKTKRERYLVVIPAAFDAKAVQEAWLLQVAANDDEDDAIFYFTHSRDYDMKALEVRKL